MTKIESCKTCKYAKCVDNYGNGTFICLIDNLDIEDPNYDHCLIYEEQAINEIYDEQAINEE